MIFNSVQRLSSNKLQPMTTHNDIPCRDNPFKHATCDTFEQLVLQHECSWTAVWCRTGRLEQPKCTSGPRVGARRAVRMSTDVRTHVHLRKCVRIARLPVAVETAAG